MDQTTEPQGLSRRDALKVLAAATGAITLSSLPDQWQKPVIEVGLLPAHAQTSAIASPISISNLADTFTGINDCGNQSGSTDNVTFDYNDLSGNVTSGSTILFQSNIPGVPSPLSINDSLVSVSGDAFRGAITIGPICTTFGQNPNVTDEVQLINAVGNASNVLFITVARPVGALETDGEGGREV